MLSRRRRHAHPKASSRNRLAILAIRLYPYDFRSAFGEEMIAILGQRRASLRELLAICWQVAWEWLAKLIGDKYVRARALPDLRMMRPAGISQEEWFLRGSGYQDRSGYREKRQPWGSDTSASR